MSRPEKQRIAVSTALYSLATGLSRFLGLAREILVAGLFGTVGASINAFTVANQVPNLIRSLVADAALGAAFVPVFNGLLERGERERAWRVASSVWWLSFIGLTIVTALSMLAAPQILGIFGYQGSLGVGLARVIFPTVVVLGLSGLATAILNTFDEFFLPAIAPVAWNIVIVAILALTVPFVHSTSGRLYAYAIGILLGTVVQFAIPLPALRRHGTIAWALDYDDPAVRRVFALMIPVTLGLGLINLNMLIDTYFATTVNGDVGPRSIEAAFRIYMLPQGMFSVAVAAVLFPALARHVANRNGRAFRGATAQGIRQIVFLLLPSSAVSAVFALPITRLLFEHGTFSSDQTPLVAYCLAAFAGGLTFNGVILLLNRAFFSLQLAWLPTFVALANLALNALLDWIFAREFGIWGIPLATSLVNVFSTILLYRLLRARVGPIDEYGTLRAITRIAVATAIAMALAYPVWYGLDRELGRFVPLQALSLGAGLAVAVLTFALVARATRIEEYDDVVRLLRRRRAA